MFMLDKSSKSGYNKNTTKGKIQGEFIMFCKNCGKVIPDGSLVCPECGNRAEGTKFCQHCGEVVALDCVVCPKCGRQIQELKSETPQIVINNSNSNINTNANTNVAVPLGKPKNKWVAFLLCFFFGVFGVHKFYEGKVGRGILYLFTAGLFGIGVLVDLIVLLTKPNPYYV